MRENTRNLIRQLSDAVKAQPQNSSEICRLLDDIAGMNEPLLPC